MLVQIEVASFAVDPSRNSPLVLLKECNGTRTLPVPIGPLEASAIAIESLKVKPEKPLTIDLVKKTIDALGGKLIRVVFEDYIDQSLFCKIHIQSAQSMILMDCRPCDAIALALRCDVPIFTKEVVFEKVLPEESISQKELLRRHIASIDTLEFGRYILE